MVEQSNREDEAVRAGEVRQVDEIVLETQPSEPAAAPEPGWTFKSWLVQRWELWRVSRLRVDVKAKCPGCGHRRLHTTFCKNRLIVHTCSVCGAIWDQPALYPEIIRGPR